MGELIREAIRTCVIWLVLATMAPDQRAILVLRDLEGMSEEEASAILHAPVGTVKSRLHRARRGFRERWTA